MRERLLIMVSAIVGAALIAIPSSIQWLGLLGNSWTGPITLTIANGTALVASAMSMVIVARRDSAPAARSLALFLSLSSLAFGAGTADWTPIAADVPAAGVRLLESLAAAATSVAALAFMRFAVRFPRMISVDEFTRLSAIAQSGGLNDGVARYDRPFVKLLNMVTAALSRFPMARANAALNRRIVRTMPTDVFRLAQRPVGIPAAVLATTSVALGLAGYAFVAFAIAGYVALMAMVLGMTYMRMNAAGGDDDDRNRALWVVEGAGLALIVFPMLGMVPFMVGGFIGTTVLFGALPIAWSLGAATFVGCLGIALFGQGALDARLAIRRTAWIAVLGVAAVGLFAVIENVMASWLTDTLGWSSTVANVAVAVIVAGVIAPFRGWLRRQSERLTSSVIHPRAIASGNVVVAELQTGADPDPAGVLGTAAVFRRVAEQVAHKSGGRIVEQNEARVRIVLPDAASAAEAASGLPAAFAQACGLLGMEGALTASVQPDDAV